MCKHNTPSYSLLHTPIIPKSKSDDDKALVAVEAGVNVKEVKSNVPSNVYLLNVAFYSFAIFALGQMFVAIFVARSQAMVGDSSAMVVDSLTYLFNSYAEKIKNKSLQENDDDKTLSDVEKEIRRLIEHDNVYG